MAQGTLKKTVLAAGLLFPLCALAAAVPPPAAATGFSWVKFLGPFHMVVLHFPIGFLTLAALMEVWFWFKPFDGGRRLIGLTLLLSGAAATLTVALGLMRASGGGYSPEVLSLHKMAGFAVTGLAMVTWLLHRRLVSAASPNVLCAIYRLSLGATLGALTVAGHQGGTLTHGKGFLSANSPAAFKSILGEDTDDVTTNSSAITAESKAVQSTDSALALKVQAIFSHKCISCHGPEKQKGKLRLDQMEIMLAGGKSGNPAIVPNDALKSNLLRLVTLPRSNEDAMPPDGKEPLTADEIATIFEWVQAGAPPFPDAK